MQPLLQEQEIMWDIPLPSLSNIVKKVVDDFMKFGKIQKGYLGIRYKEIDDQFAKDNDLPAVKGVYVQEVIEGGAAEKAGIKKGDVILQMQGMPVDSKSELQEIINQHNPGDKTQSYCFP